MEAVDLANITPPSLTEQYSCNDSDFLPFLPTGPVQDPPDLNFNTYWTDCALQHNQSLINLQHCLSKEDLSIPRSTAVCLLYMHS